MRIAFFLLLLANVVFFAYSWFGEELFPGESLLLQQQINPQAIVIVAPAKLARAEPEPARNAACLEWGAFVAGEAGRAERALASLASGSTLSRRRVEEAATWWVFMPPQGGRAAAIGKAAELKRLGINEYFIVQEDPKYRFAISLGIFRTQEAAANHLEQLRARGVRTAQVGTREAKDSKLWLQLRDVPKAVAARLDDLRKTFPDSVVRECAAEAGKS